FVRGWRPSGDGKLALIDGVFLEIVEAAKAEPDRPFVLVIEEINRGNPAQIFGEVLTLLEDTKRSRDEAMELAYRREPSERVYVPRNLYVIGTMNIADRSLALVDLALRRRFAFVSLEPRLNGLWREWCANKCGLAADTISLIE
ncbi:AAA family ATPase, partial [Mesorhizobium sp. M6A.T.Ca.TU.002.02.2.1]